MIPDSRHAQTGHHRKPRASGDDPDSIMNHIDIDP